MSHWISFVLIGLATGSVVSRLFLPARRHDARGVVVIAAVFIACTIGGLTHLLAGRETGGTELLINGLTTALLVGAIARAIRARGADQRATPISHTTAPTSLPDRKRRNDLHHAPRVPGSAGRS